MSIEDAKESPPFGYEDTSYQTAGGIAGIRKLVNTFYHYVDSLEDAVNLRQLHQQNLDESREKLSLFLSGWLGGPAKYQEKYGAINIPEAHKRIKVSATSAGTWLMCMDRAIDEQGYSNEFSNYLKAQFRIPAKRIVDAQ